MVNEAEVELLDQLLKPPNDLRHKHAVRVQAVLGRARGRGTMDLAESLCVHPMSISKWVRMYNERGVQGLVARRHAPCGEAAGER